MKAMKKMTMPAVSPAREVSRKLQFTQGYPILLVRSHPDGYLIIMKGNESVALVIKNMEGYAFLSEEGKNEYPCSSLEQVALLVSVLQQSGCDWHQFDEFFYYNREELDLDFD